MKKTTLFIIPIVSLLLFSVPFLFAANTDRHVYGVITETYNGAHDGYWNNSDATNIDMWSNSGTAKFELAYENPLEGNKFRRTTILTSSGWQVFVVRPVSGESTSPKNMSGFYGGSVKFLARVTSDNSAFLTAKVGVQLTADNHLTTTLSDLHLVADGDWHELSIPLNSSFGVNSASDLSAVIGLFTFQPVTLSVGKYIDIDNVRWVRSTAGSFSADLKNIGSNTSATTITWNENVFRNGWKVADQYVNLDLDLDVGRTWSIRVYTDNGSGDKAGLVATHKGKTYFLPMAWRVNKRFLPSDEGSLNVDYTEEHVESQIVDGQTVWNTKGLYDISKGRFWHPWLFFVDEADENFSTPEKEDYMTVWSNKGFHSDDGGAYWGMSDVSESGGTIAPKLYFAANFDNAVSGVTYSGNIVVELNYE